MPPPERHDAVIVGAGISGLSLARALLANGRRPLVLERARGVGGRCATRRVDGRPVDHGLPFLHGREARFLAALAAASSDPGTTPIPDWPRVREGRGLPCQPEAFEGTDVRVAFQEGVSRFPKHLAHGIQVRVSATVVSLELDPNEPAVWVVLSSGERIATRVAALTMPAPTAMALLQMLAPSSPAAGALSPLLEEIRTVACLAVIAVYGDRASRPKWEAWYPLSTTMVHSVLHDSSKRPAGTPLTLVIQGRPRFSRENADEPRERWGRELLWEAGEFMGRWVEEPATMQCHAWHHARVDPSSELAAPLAVRLENGAVLALCGDGLSPSGGAEGAFLSGLGAAARIETLGTTLPHAARAATPKETPWPR